MANTRPRLSSPHPPGTLHHEHGLRTTYINHQCRCAPCCQANTDYIRKYRKALTEDARKWREHQAQQEAEAS